MFNESLSLNGKEEMKSKIALVENEVMNRQIIGEFRDIIRHADGRVEVSEWDRNCIINNIGLLIACLFKNQAGYTGIGYWAVGSGSDTWDNTNPTAAVATDTKCLNEIGRLAIPSNAITFVDGSGNDTGTVTNRIRIDITFGVNDCNGTWREFCIYGGNATTTKDSGIAINHKNHGIIVKTNLMTIERQIRFTFN